MDGDKVGFRKGEQGSWRREDDGGERMTEVKEASAVGGQNNVRRRDQRARRRLVRSLCLLVLVGRAVKGG